MADEHMIESEPEATELESMQAVAEDGPVEETQAEDNCARLILKRNGALTEVEFRFTSPATIGRFDPAFGPVEVDLSGIEEGKYVSRKHAAITCEDGVWSIRDLGSSNKTYVLREDFEPVEAALLEDGTEIALGNARFVFHSDSSAG